MDINKKIEEIQIKTEKFRNKINFKKSYKYILLTIFIGVGYIFFLTSGFIFESSNRITSTELNKKITLKNSEIMIIDEKLNKENNLLQIKIKTNKTNINFANDYEFEAITKEDTNKKLSVEFLEVDENNIVVFITTPKKWSAVALDIKEKNAKEVGEQRIYISKDVCVEDNQLKIKSKEEYMIENIEIDIESINETINQYENEVTEKQETIGNIKSEISTLEDKKEYLTDKEKSEVNQKIDSYNNNITSLETAIKDIESKINEEREKEKMLNKKMNDIIKTLPNDLYNKYR